MSEHEDRTTVIRKFIADSIGNYRNDNWGN